VLPEHALREHLHEGRLVRLCPAWIWKSVTLYALTPSKASQRPALAAFLTMLKEQVTRDARRWVPASEGRA
jgi:DNA-binding transcriptional LysR family regulator